MNKRDVNLINYLPTHLSNIEEFKQMCKALDKELNLLWDELEGFTLDIDMYTMSERMCEKWERFFNIKDSSLKTLDARRQLIRGYFSSQLPYTEGKLKSILDSMCGENGYELDVSITNQEVTIGIKLSQAFTEDNVRTVVRKMAPSHMQVTVKVLYNRWKQFTSKTWKEMSAYTWEDMRSNTIFQQEA